MVGTPPEPVSERICPRCTNPITPGEPVIHSAVFGSPEPVHWACGLAWLAERHQPEPPSPPEDDEEAEPESA